MESLRLLQCRRRLDCWKKSLVARRAARRSDGCTITMPTRATGGSNSFTLMALLENCDNARPDPLVHASIRVGSQHHNSKLGMPSVLARRTLRQAALSTSRFLHQGTLPRYLVRCHTAFALYEMAAIHRSVLQCPLRVTTSRRRIARGRSGLPQRTDRGRLR